MEEKDYKYIDRYLNGTLSPDDVKNFEIRLIEDPKFYEEFDFQKSAHINLKRKENQQAFQKQINILGDKYFSSDATIINKNPTAITKSTPVFWIGIATTAAVALILILFPWEPDNLYSTHGIHSPLALVEKSTGTNDAAAAQNAFNNKDYAAAYTSLKSYLIDTPENYSAQLALGVSALELDKFEEAKNIFIQLSTSGPSFKNYGLWYLALTYLKQDQVDECKSYLHQMEVTDDPYLLTRKKKLLKALK